MPYENTKHDGHLKNIHNENLQILSSNYIFFGPCIFNDEDEINQQNAQINSGLIYY